MTKRFELPPIPESERTPRVQVLLGIIEGLIQEVQRQEERIGQLEDEIAVLKGEKKRRRFKPSKLDETTGEEDSEGDDSKTRGNARGAIHPGPAAGGGARPAFRTDAQSFILYQYHQAQITRGLLLEPLREMGRG
jgi:hypothetical protein